MRKVLQASFLNTGIMIILVNADLQYAPLGLKYIPFAETGIYNDFGLYWYHHNGRAIVQTMFIQAIYPWIELAIFGGIRQLKRILDSGSCPCCRSGIKTKCKT